MSYFLFQILIYIHPRHACHHHRHVHNSIIVIDFLKSKPFVSSFNPASPIIPSRRMKFEAN